MVLEFIANRWCVNTTCCLNAVGSFHHHKPSAPPWSCLVPLRFWPWIPVCDCERRRREPDSTPTPDRCLMRQRKKQWGWNEGQWITIMFISNDLSASIAFYIQRDFSPSPPASQSFTPPFTQSHEVWGEKTAIPASTARTASRCFQSFWTRRLIGRNNGGWYEIMRSQLTATASSMTASVRSLVSRTVLTGRGLLGSTSKPTLSQDSASDSGASCSKTCRTSFNSIRLDEWAEEKLKDGGRRAELCLLGRMWWLWVDEGREWRTDEKAEEHRAARDLKLCLVQSLLLVSEKNVQERFLHPVNIRGDLCGQKEITK